jgi:hypothetical protein
MPTGRDCGSLTVIAVALVSVLGSAGAASADSQYNGQTYAQAQAAITKTGMTSKIGTVVGDQVPTAQCIVTGSRTLEVLGSSGTTGGSEVLLDLDCSSAAQANASATATPSSSQAPTSPTGGG